jgi:S1-C subfamily serine protease
MAVVAAVALLVLFVAEHGGFSQFARASFRPAIPGVTVENGAARRTPVVTSVRTDSQAQKRGLRVGDDILSVDGRRVRDVQALRDAVVAAGNHAPLDLDVQRGDAVWTVSIDRAEPAEVETANVTEVADGAKNLAD